MAEPRWRALGGLARGLARVVVIAHGVLLALQPFSAGSMLDASAGAVAWHAGVGGGLILVGMIQVAVLVLAWRPGRWPAWPILVSVLVAVAEIVQVALGGAGALALHVPLGVTLVGTGVALAGWVCFSDRARRPR